MLKQQGRYIVDDVILNKAANIERCIERVREEYQGFEQELLTNFTKQDAILMNIQRACEAAIDMATHVARIRKLGVPQGSRDSFALLEKTGLIDSSSSKKLQSMVGFRNIAVHNYTQLDFKIVEAIINERLNDVLAFSQNMVKSI